MCSEIDKDNKCEMRQIEDIWRKRSIEVHRFVSPDPDTFWRAKLPGFRDQIRPSGCKGFVCKKDGLVKGFITYQESNGCIYIRELFVDESRKKFGTKLLKEVEGLNKSNRLSLHVYALNIPAINWYFWKGFVIDDVRECTDEDLQDFTCEKDRLKYRSQRVKYHMVKLP
jgi:GNAT superfamily N-acetyltransferase